MLSLQYNVLTVQSEVSSPKNCVANLTGLLQLLYTVHDAVIVIMTADNQYSTLL
jgi:hypothetical protein